VVNLKLKRAEYAFSDGRFDEAFELVSNSETLSHRAGQVLAGKVGRALTERGGEHLLADRIEQSLADCNKAAKLLGNTADVSELRSMIVKAMERKRLSSEQSQEKLAMARENIEDGWLSVGEEILQDEQADQAQALLQNAAVVRAKSSAVLAKARLAMEAGQVETAVEILGSGRIKDISFQDPALCGKICKEICDDATGNLNIGRIDLAARKLELLDRIDVKCLEAEELTDAVAQCRKARGYVASGRLGWAVELFGRLKMMLPDARWIADAYDEASKGASAIESLRSGPLGLAGSCVMDDRSANTETEQASVKQKTQRKRKSAMAEIVPSKFILQVDGVGSYLVLSEDSITIGPVSSSERCDVAIIAAADMPVATIDRAQGDYFIKSNRPISVNDNAVTSKLLAGGDKIALSNRCRMKFVRSNSASNTAELIASAVRFTRADITGVILMDSEILIGAGGSNHIRTDQISGKVMLLLRDGKLICRSKEGVEIDGVSKGNESEIGIGQAVRVGAMGITVVKD
jgi:tetratricopeptide (TPR) repeat protein